ncbi:MAG TPA: hypothetical protein VMV94_12620 [Phycisphaerae bacterium]|nr:hypothetical protein [Phycisphaerae bacterium]
MDKNARLCPNILAQIVDRFGARLQGQTGAESFDCWRFPLHRCKAVARTEFGGDRKEYVGIEIIDLGIRGLGFRTDAPVTKGALFTVILRIPGIPLQTWNCRVVNVHSFDGKDYVAGARFEGQFDSESVSTLLE